MGRDHSSYRITWLSHLGFGWGGEEATYIITWLSHLGFGWESGEGSFFLSNYLTQPFKVWLGGGEGSFFLYSNFGWGVGRDHSSYLITWLSHLGFGWGDDGDEEEEEEDDDEDEDEDEDEVSRSDAWGVARSDALDVSRSESLTCCQCRKQLWRWHPVKRLLLAHRGIVTNYSYVCFASSIKTQGQSQGLHFHHATSKYFTDE